MATLKAIISSKKNLQSKYGIQFNAVDNLLEDIVNADIKRGLKTIVVYIDDAASCLNAGIQPVRFVNRQTAKRSVDAIYKNLNPAYIVLFGSGDIFPFQEINNLLNDDDSFIPSDLPYACDASYSNNISSFTGPTRVVGRIPDIQGVPDLDYLKTVIDSIVNYKQVKSEKLLDYFSISTDVWKKSTQQSLSNMFGNNVKLKLSPTQNSPHNATDLKPLTHFYNCHGSPSDSKYYGEKGNSFPIAQHSTSIDKKISVGTIVAAECCYGAELYDPNNESNRELCMANMYFKNRAIAFMGSTTIAYGPAVGNSLADLITQYFIRNVIRGASTGHAMLDARQKFLSVNGPHLDPYELKTLAQFYLLGDPSIHAVVETLSKSSSESVENRRLNLFNKGINLKATLAPSERVQSDVKKTKKKTSPKVQEIFKETGFTGNEDETLFEVKTKNKKVAAFAKGFSGQERITYRTFVQKPKKVNGLKVFDVLVLKESGDDVLGWRLYHRK